MRAEAEQYSDNILKNWTILSQHFVKSNIFIEIMYFTRSSIVIYSWFSFLMNLIHYESIITQPRGAFSLSLCLCAFLLFNR